MKDQATGRFNATDHLHHHIHLGVIDHLAGIGGQHGIGQINRAGSTQIPHGHTNQVQIGNQRMTLLWIQQNLSHPAANGAQPQKTYADPCAHSP